MKSNFTIKNKKIMNVVTCCVLEHPTEKMGYLVECQFQNESVCLYYSETEAREDEDIVSFLRENKINQILK